MMRNPTLRRAHGAALLASAKKAAMGASTEEINTGKATIGSGRYKLVKRVSGDRVELVRNDNCGGEKSPWEKVQALQQVNDENRLFMLQEATKLAMADLGLMPIHFQFTIWATKKGVTYVPRTDEYTLAFQFKAAKS